MNAHEFRATKLVPGWCVRCGEAPFMHAEDRCVVCASSAPRHGGLCCSHRYDEQPECPGGCAR